MNESVVQDRIDAVQAPADTVQARIDACALIDLDRRKDLISRIAADTGVPVMEAARRYVRGNINAIARNKSWDKALDEYEAIQVGGAVKRSISRKVLGGLRVMWDTNNPSAEDDYFTTQDIIAKADRERRVDDLLGDYWEAYVSQLSRTVRAHLEELILDQHEPGYIMSNAGAIDPETRKLRQLVANLYRVWEHRDAVSRGEMLALMRQYLEVIPDAYGVPDGRGVPDVPDAASIPGVPNVPIKPRREAVSLAAN
jgi:hypothetical protein